MMLNSVFARRLYLCWLLDTEQKPNVPKLMEITGWPRRTLQDVLKALPGMGVELEFVQQGVRNNDGYYQLSGWGPLDAKWIERHRQQLLNAIEHG
ncbi:winged helix-turn-helix domain-containing protein [Rahnella aquatilis]|uniref:winged helix-turn-helix domain-containing protein n=1 Tax=Rahnella aquatilis TaxID=34038 RepID=UPI00187D4F8F|nr:winged helix-turn-helix domain-containing protein [Rahnella aquatilis]